jgi:cytochrome c peroxidase
MQYLIAVVALMALPLPALAQAGPQVDAALVEKGRTLFNDASLSASGQHSCATCHPMGGHTDNKTYLGVEVVADGDPRGRSTPTLWGAGQRQSGWLWAGNIPTLDAGIRSIIVDRMKGPEPTPETLAALAAYTRSLPNGPSPLLDKDGMLLETAPADAKRGWQLFAGKAGCVTCHEPPTYESKGVEDVGSGGTFKAPSLRSVSRTAPYFHDGRFKTLEEAVDAMSYGAVSLMSDDYLRKAGITDKLSDAEKRDIVAFLKAL